MQLLSPSVSDGGVSPPANNNNQQQSQPTLTQTFSTVLPRPTANMNLSTGYPIMYLNPSLQTAGLFGKSGGNGNVNGSPSAFTPPISLFNPSPAFLQTVNTFNHMQQFAADRNNNMNNMGMNRSPSGDNNTSNSYGEYGRRARHIKTPQQLKQLKAFYINVPRPSKDDIKQLTMETGLPPPEITRWFRNERHKEKKTREAMCEAIRKEKMKVKEKLKKMADKKEKEKGEGRQMDTQSSNSDSSEDEASDSCESVPFQSVEGLLIHFKLLSSEQKRRFFGSTLSNISLEELHELENMIRDTKNVLEQADKPQLQVQTNAPSHGMVLNTPSSIPTLPTLPSSGTVSPASISTSSTMDLSALTMPPTAQHQLPLNTLADPASQFYAHDDGKPQSVSEQSMQLEAAKQLIASA